MKQILPFLLLILIYSCSKNNCQSCTMVIVGPDPQNMNKIKKDTIYANRQFCGDDLKEQKAQNNKITETKIGTTTYRWTTVVTTK